MRNEHQWKLVEVPRSDRLFNLLYLMFPVGWPRKWMLKQPFRRWLFTKAGVDE